ncbi:alpha/beta hydrolase [Cellulomonas sp. SG140]|uniref:alpha/beta hydrolase n=1 Tax=Cellulomonas sp. SG140 TaxID=2976536 RepID=UPI0021E9AD89|nr:alpha/beta hydrolase [Cellulomonas sp. SG140]
MLAGTTAALTILVLGVAGCSGPRTPRLELGSCGTDGPDHPERCAVLQVPVDWADPHSPRMGLQVLVVPARSDHPAPDPLFYLAGFGSSAIGDAEWAYRTFAPLEDRHDLVFVEQRGTGATAETCALPPEGEGDLAAIGPAVTQCLGSLRRDPRHDTTAAAVRDLDAAREALGYEAIDLYGISYGVTMGLAYLQAHPERVRTAVLDSGSLLDVRLWQRVPTSAQRAFDALVRDCAASPACTSAYDPATDLATLVHRLSAAPEVVDLGDGHTMTVDAAGLTGAVVDAYLATPATAVLLPRDLRAMVRGEWTDVLRARGLLPAAVNAEAGRVQVQTLTIRCSDEWAQMTPDVVAAQEGSLFTANTLARARWQQALCTVWPHDDGVRGTVQTSAPVVLLNGEHDPADPPENVAPAARSMSASLAVTVPGGGHGVVDGCIVDEVMSFIEAGRAPDPAAWAACTDTWRGVAPSFPAS